MAIVRKKVHTCDGVGCSYEQAEPMNRAKLFDLRVEVCGACLEKIIAQIRPCFKPEVTA